MATSANDASRAVDTSADPTEPKDQLEMFLYKFPEVGREDLQTLLNQFIRFDRLRTNKLEEDAAMMLFEARGHVKTFVELREMAKAFDFDGDHTLSFLEMATGIFEKDWVELHNLGDRAEYEKAMRVIKEAEAAREEAAAKRAAELESEAKLTGVAGMRAFFARQAEKTKDGGDDPEGLTNEQRIKAEAARRKQLREAQEGNAQEKIAKQKAEAEARAIREAAQAKAERARRQAEFKAKHSAIFERNKE